MAPHLRLSLRRHFPSTSEKWRVILCPRSSAEVWCNSARISTPCWPLCCPPARSPVSAMLNCSTPCPSVSSGYRYRRRNCRRCPGRRPPRAIRRSARCRIASDCLLRFAIGCGVSCAWRRHRRRALADRTIPLSDAIYVWGILAGSAIGLLASTLGRLYASSYFALRDTRTPLRYALVRVMLTAAQRYVAAIPLPLRLGIPLRWGAAGLTASAGLAGWVEMFLLRLNPERAYRSNRVTEVLRAPVVVRRPPLAPRLPGP